MVVFGQLLPSKAPGIQPDLIFPEKNRGCLPLGATECRLTAEVDSAVQDLRPDLFAWREMASETVFGALVWSLSLNAISRI